MSDSYGRVDPAQRDAEERLGVVISRVLLAVGLLAALGLVIPGGSGFAWAAVVVAVAIPIVRVIWLTVRWAKLKDTRFVWAAVALLLLIAVGPIIALV
ncbi:MAG: hypothetical protein RL643_971 [Actinomycetota bacterium]|jgi:uncharacterized membrane protein